MTFRVISRWHVLAMALVSVLLLPVAAKATPTFLSAVNISDAGQDGFEPQVAIDGSGNVTAVWTRSDGTNFRIQAATRTPLGQWSASQTLSDPGQSASSPAVAVSPAGDALAVWTRSDGTNGRIQAAFAPAGGLFGAPINVSDAFADATAPDVSMDSNGKAIVVWSRFDGTKLRVQAATRTAGAGGVFSAIQTLSVGGQDAFDPQVAAGPNADANGAVVWTRSDGANLRVQSSRRKDLIGYVRPKGATPDRIPLVPAFNQCTTGNRTHSLPLASPSCNPPVRTSSSLTIGSPDANGFTANFIGSIRLIVVTGNLATEADEADVRLVVSLTDIRNNPGGSDYTGKVLASVPLQLTDNNNTTETPEPGTAQGLNLEFPVQCTATGDANIGGACGITTTVDTLIPGTVLENKRNIWEVGQATVKDAGPNGTGYDSCPPTCGDGDETTFLRQGIFAP